MVEPPDGDFFFCGECEQVHLYGGAARSGFGLMAGAPIWWSRQYGREVKQMPFCN